LALVHEGAELLEDSGRSRSGMLVGNGLKVKHSLGLGVDVYTASVQAEFVAVDLDPTQKLALDAFHGCSKDLSKFRAAVRLRVEVLVDRFLNLLKREI